MSIHGDRHFRLAGSPADELDSRILADYLLKMGNGAAIKRIVYLADFYNIDVEKREALEAAFTTGYSKLDPTLDRDGTYSRNYRLKLNVSEGELIATDESP